MLGRRFLMAFWLFVYVSCVCSVLDLLVDCYGDILFFVSCPPVHVDSGIGAGKRC